MQKYFFHIRQDGVLTEDPDGSEFKTLDEAHDYAVSSAREILANNVKMGRSLTVTVLRSSDQMAR